MANLYDIDQGHTKDATDTKERTPIGRPTIDRYPMPARITAVNGGGASYNCIEVNPATGADISGYTHNTVPNRGDATLAVNDVVPLFYEQSNEVFFFVKRLKAVAVRLYIGGVRRINWEPGVNIWKTYDSEFVTGAVGSSPFYVTTHVGGAQVGQSSESEIYNLLEANSECSFFWLNTESASPTSLLTPVNGTLFDFLSTEQTDADFPDVVDISYTQRLKVVSGAGKSTSNLILALPHATLDSTLYYLTLNTAIYIKPGDADNCYISTSIVVYYSGGSSLQAYYMTYFTPVSEKSFNMRWVIEKA